MGNPDRKVKITKIISRLVPAAIILMAVMILVLEWDMMEMRSHYEFSTAAHTAFGSEGIVVVDRGKTAIEILDGKHRLVKRLKGEREDRFYYADLVLEDGNTTYIADTVYDRVDQTRIKKRLVALEGTKQKVLFEREYDPAEHPESNCQILEVQVHEGNLYFILSVEYGLELYRLEAGSEESTLVERYYCGDRINDASIDLSSGKVAIAVKRGYVRVYEPSEGKWITVASESGHLMPNCIAIRNCRVFFSDLYENKVYRYDADQTGNMDTLIQINEKPVSLEVSADGERVLVGSAKGFYQIADGKTEYIGETDFRYFAVTILLRVVLGIAALCVLWLFRLMLPKFIRLMRNENSIRVVIVVSAVVVVSCFVAYSIMDELFGREEENLIDHMKLYAELMAEQTDTQAISRMEGESFYGTSAYKTLRQPLDDMTKQAFLDGKYYRYTIYTADENGVYFVCNFDDDVMCGEPYDIPDDTYYRRVVETGDSYALSTRDAEGNWINLLTPLKAEDGRIIALLEVRLDMSLRNKEQGTAVRNTVINVFCTTAVMMMLILEGVLLLSFMERKRRLTVAERSDPTFTVPLRMLIFFTNAADSMQDAFVAILCAELYKGQLPLPDSVAVALPLSAQLLMLALCSSFMGSVGEKHGPVKVMGGGLLVQCAGCICCVLTGSYFGLLIGKMMIGAGMGTVYVNCYAIAAKGKTEESSAAAFTEISAGSLSGVTIGAGLSSVFLTVGGWKMVYMVGAVLLGIAILLSMSSRESRLQSEAAHASAKNAEKIPEGGIAEFMLNAPVLGYFLLILLPFMMSLAYREYFLPLAAGENNVSEVNISRFYLVCGLAFLYIGPVVTRFLRKHLGMLKGVFLASSLMAAAMLLYVVRPTMGMVFFGMVMLSFVTSFSYGCMYTFFGELPQTARYGEAKSMEVYTVFESIGSTAGPLSYGILLSFGNRLGLLIFGVTMLLFVGIYAMIMRTNMKFNMRKSGK